MAREPLPTALEERGGAPAPRGEGPAAVRRAPAVTSDAPAHLRVLGPLGEGPQRVLILKPCCLGDVVMATPLAATIRAALPAAEILWAVDGHSAPALANSPDVNAILDATGCVRGSFQVGALLRLLAVMRHGRFDVTFVPDRSPVLALLPMVAGVPIRVGLDSHGRGRAHTVRVQPATDRHETEVYLDLARAVGMRTADPRPVFVPSASDRGTAQRVVADLDGGGPLVAVHPGGGVNPGMVLREKRWPADRFGALALRLTRDRGASIVVLGAVPATWRDRVANVAGELTLPESAAVVERCALYIGNDSGMAHLASAVGTPVVAVFGPTDPRRYGPVPGAGVAVAPRERSVERLADARGSSAVLEVAVDDVWSASIALLDGGTRPPGGASPQP